jgi:hypothetical protein
MYIKAKILPGMCGGGMKESRGGVNSSMISLIHCKNFCKYSNVPPTQNNNKNKFKNSPVFKLLREFPLSSLTYGI